MSRFLLIILLSMGVSLVSCKKGEQGDTGPQGATGATGSQGNANVKIRIDTVATWIGGSSGNYGAQISAPELTLDIMQNGTVMVQLSDGGPSGPWIILPWEPISLGYIYAYHYALEPLPCISNGQMAYRILLLKREFSKHLL
jgi:hypothetical protein